MAHHPQRVLKRSGQISRRSSGRLRRSASGGFISQKQGPVTLYITICGLIVLFIGIAVLLARATPCRDDPKGVKCHDYKTWGGIFATFGSLTLLLAAAIAFKPEWFTISDCVR